MQQVSKICLSCKHFRLEDTQSGVCRLHKESTQYPMKLNRDTCPFWRSCGQQYYIRTGWIKSKLATREEQERQ